MKFIKSDFVVATLLLGTWVFYLTYDGSTRFDLSQTLTLPLLAAADLTGLAILYAVGRYHFAKKKGELIADNLNKQITDNQAEQTQGENHSENHSQDNKS